MSKKFSPLTFIILTMCHFFSCNAMEVEPLEEQCCRTIFNDLDSLDRSIQIWGPESKEIYSCYLTLPGDMNCVYRQVNLGDGCFASVSSQNTIKIWVPSPDEIYECHQMIINYGILRNPGIGLMALSEMCRTTLWIKNSGGIYDRQDTLLEHARGIDSLIKLSNGYIVAGIHDHTIKIWDPLIDLSPLQIALVKALKRHLAACEHVIFYPSWVEVFLSLPDRLKQRFKNIVCT